MTVVVYHNPECGTSRGTLDMIKEAGHVPVVIEYMQTGWTRPQLLGLFAAAKITAREALRTHKTNAEELGLTDPLTSEEQILDAMTQFPKLVNRPIVCSPLGVRLCRPSETVLDILPPTGEGND